MSEATLDGFLSKIQITREEDLVESDMPGYGLTDSDKKEEETGEEKASSEEDKEEEKEEEQSEKGESEEESDGEKEEKDDKEKDKDKEEKDKEEKKEKRKVSKETLGSFEEKLESLTDADLKKVIFRCLNIENDRKAKKDVGEMVDEKDDVKEDAETAKHNMLLERMAELGGVAEERVLAEGYAERLVLSAIDSLDSLDEVIPIIRDIDARKSVKKMVRKISNILLNSLESRGRNPSCDKRTMRRY